MSVTSTHIEKWKTYSEIIIVWFTIMTTLFGGGYALFQYTENSKAERAKETLKFIERFDKDKFSNSCHMIDPVFDSIEKATREKYSENAKGMSLLDEDKEFLEYLKETINANELLPHLNNIFDFYDQLEACSIASLCDTKLATRFFGKYAFYIVGIIYPYIEMLRKESGDRLYGAGIEYFFNEYKKQLNENKGDQPKNRFLTPS